MSKAVPSRRVSGAGSVGGPGTGRPGRSAAAARATPAAVAAGRSIVGAPSGSASSSSKTVSKPATAVPAVPAPAPDATKPGPSTLVGNPSRPSSRAGAPARWLRSSSRLAAGGSGVAGSPRTVQDDELRAALLKVFEWCDADSDGVISAAEFTAAQRLIAELRGKDLDDGAATAAFEAAGSGQGKKVDQAAFLDLMPPLLAALELPRRELLDGLARQTSQASTAFDRAVSELKHGLVRNATNLPDEGSLASGGRAPAPAPLWRTTTGSNVFKLPPGVAGGHPAALVAYKALQFLSMRTEDATIVRVEVAGAMMGHRQQFKQMFDMCGEVAGVHVTREDGKELSDSVGSEAGVVRADLFLAHPPPADQQMFRLRIGQFSISGNSADPTQMRCTGMGGFEPSPVEPSEVPSKLLADIQMGGPGATASAPPPPLPLKRAVTSMPSDDDLQSENLVLVAVPVARHLFRLRFRLAGARMPEAHYMLLVPRIVTSAAGHPRYADHAVRVLSHNARWQPEVRSFCNFVVANIPGNSLGDLVLEHEFINCRVRLKPRSEVDERCGGDCILPVPVLDPEERALNLADDFAQAQHIRQLLESQGLARRADERDVTFAVRLGRALCNGYRYDAAVTEANLQKLPTLIWEKRCGDCSAFNTGFVYALRAFGVPARVSLGFKYGHAVRQACNSFVATHAQAEFFVEGVGWTPCDATLGVRRLGHEAGSQLSFVEWRPAVRSLAEAEEQAKVLTSPSDPGPARERLMTAVERLSGSGPQPVKKLAAGLAKAEGLAMDTAALRAAQVVASLGMPADEELTPEEFARGVAAVELGKFGELGMGDGLASTAQAGAKFYEGGPFRGKPLKMSDLKENMMVMDGIEGVMDHVGCSDEARRQAADWGRMWPYGVFLCSCDFEEKPL
eukprot:gnl/TRDRNA2_/TRDRNA2_151239_c0_seq1.p1 gnl/TRDRNA2_/TRDRNA2_151239_c0~~gnl/TRDRNA2_/TRDRNA2_151239_c0_seq1.p1  ORF type:complete len:906 (+),score=148.61 gnl/TRDRNA2_/TRDRNA2_151239_c0_seq1:60-2777(+)